MWILVELVESVDVSDVSTSLVVVAIIGTEMVV